MIRKASYPYKLNHEDIARCAYLLYEKQGRQPGHDLDDWLEAEAQLLGAVAPEDDEEVEPTSRNLIRASPTWHPRPVNPGGRTREIARMHTSASVSNDLKTLIPSTLKTGGIHAAR